MTTNRSKSKFLEQLRSNNPQETEFHQAVEEVTNTIWSFLEDNPKYQDAKILERLTEPDRTVRFRVCWEDDKGNIQVNRGWRIQFCNAIGPYKGGLRFHPSVNQSILKFLGFEQIFKNALTGLPMGGAKGGSDFDPKGKSDREVMRFCQAFMNELYRHIGQFTDVPAGDIGVGAREIGYLFGHYKKITNQFTGVLTGKSLAYGGSKIRPEATGYGCVYFCEHMLKHKGDSLKGKTCLISGSGNVAIYTAEKIIDLGGKVITMSDSSGFIHDPNGIDDKKLAFIKELKEVKRGRIEEYAQSFDGVTFHPDKAPWDIKAEVAFPCATQNEIDQNHAQQMIENGIMAVSEGANMPSTLKAIATFQKEDILFGPAKAANAGGVAVSGLEQSQNALRLSWDKSEVDIRLQSIMKSIHQQCVAHGEKSEGEVDYVRGANIAGFIKVADAMLAFGVS